MLEKEFINTGEYTPNSHKERRRCNIGSLKLAEKWSKLQKYCISLEHGTDAEVYHEACWVVDLDMFVAIYSKKRNQAIQVDYLCTSLVKVHVR